MFTEQTPAPDAEPGNGMLKYLMVSALAFLIVGAYLGWVFYSRHQANQAIEDRAVEKRRVEDRQAFEMMGGNNFAILGFYAYPASIPAGDTTSLCYSVSNAKTVKLEPQTEPVWPAFSRCVNAAPKKNTTYTLTIEDGAGHSKAATIEVKVR